MTIYTRGHKELDDWGVIASCEDCGCAFSVHYDDLKWNHDPNKYYYDNGISWTNLEKIETEEQYNERMEGNERRKQAAMNTAYSTHCANCKGEVFIDLVSIPQYVRNFVDYYTRPQKGGCP